MGNRRALLLASAVALAIVLGSDVLTAPRTPEICTDEETREHVRNIMLTGLDEALKDQVMHVYSIWLKDERDQPARAGQGVRQAVSAYLRARAGALAWQPPRCEP